MNATLRKCTNCGFMAHNESELVLFIKRKQSKYGRSNLCKWCANTRVAKSQIRQRARDPVAWAKRKRRDTRKAHRRRRMEVIDHYGGKCACCSETELKFLGMDHVNGGGNEHRRQMKSQNIYVWLKKNNWPDEFQVLCHNCNLSKGFYGQCPHKE